MRRRYLITGGSGFVGSRLAQWLVGRGHDVAITFRTMRHPPRGIHAVCWPDVAAPASAIDGPFDVLVHAAALTDLAACQAQPGRALAVNADGAGHAVDLARRVGARVIYLSTLGVYGEPKRLPLSEADPTEPIEAYAVSKLAGERRTTERAQDTGTAWAIVRSFNLYGPGQTGERLIPWVIEQALRSDVIRVREARSTRDFLYIDDLCEAIEAVAESRVGGVFNAGTGVETSVTDVVREVGRLLGRCLTLQVEGVEGPPIVHRSRAATDKIRQATGWRARTPLAEGLRRTLASSAAPWAAALAQQQAGGVAA